ncbi:FbpB family small basic protein [Cytobacillus sp. S13-E01]|nr:FbpB family small basic protein [Cytobacillus sp. S13-E01]MDF0728380.1 FbpB family small basic protein [Cytobacillus sp. S13-E01]
MRKRSAMHLSFKKLIDKNKQDIIQDSRQVEKIIEKIEERHIKTENR